MNNARQSQGYAEPRRAYAYSQSPGPRPVIPLRSKVYVCGCDHENPGSQEPADMSDFLNLRPCANLIDHRANRLTVLGLSDFRLPQSPGNKKPALEMSRGRV